MDPEIKAGQFRKAHYPETLVTSKITDGVGITIYDEANELGYLGNFNSNILEDLSFYEMINQVKKDIQDVDNLEVLVVSASGEEDVKHVSIKLYDIGDLMRDYGFSEDNILKEVRNFPLTGFHTYLHLKDGETTFSYDRNSDLECFINPFS